MSHRRKMSGTRNEPQADFVRAMTKSDKQNWRAPKSSLVSFEVQPKRRRWFNCKGSAGARTRKFSDPTSTKAKRARVGIRFVPRHVPPPSGALRGWPGMGQTSHGPGDILSKPTPTFFQCFQVVLKWDGMPTAISTMPRRRMICSGHQHVNGGHSRRSRAGQRGIPEAPNADEQWKPLRPRSASVCEASDEKRHPHLAKNWTQGLFHLASCGCLTHQGAHWFTSEGFKDETRFVFPALMCSVSVSTSCMAWTLETAVSENVRTVRDCLEIDSLSHTH
ncbi:hypothetical protein N658DRAFT_292184 [Parathielavia hyrcaniae]|uniref:Uncharacterized protein n=1 Tax=Parathielavia hyrcaniae TaxID=113614 RepID=A0AAN6SXW0_9PEZI|nr:hypothetical protein N658DRAFT_292184 [Parathielavia hyrcaniae]